MNPALPLALAACLVAGCAGSDKAAHALAGAAISAVATEATGSPLIGCVAALSAGAAKEAWDAQGHGIADFGDFAATGAGCAVSLAF